MRLSSILRVNHRSFDPKLSELVLAALPRLALNEGEMPGQCSEYEQVAALIDAWPQLCRQMPAPADDAATAFIDARIARLRRWLADAGLGDPQAAALAASEDSVVCAEMAALAREGLWHLRQIAYDALHRWPELQTDDGKAASSAVGQWVAAGLSVARGTK